MPGDLDGADANTMISGSGKIFVYATDYLNIIITGSGSVYYRGSPRISSTITGFGSFRPY